MSADTINELDESMVISMIFSEIDTGDDGYAMDTIRGNEFEIPTLEERSRLADAVKSERAHYAPNVITKKIYIFIHIIAI